MKIDTIQTSFVGGEFAPSLFGRTDVAQYENACETVENFLVRPFGSAISTPGTEFIAECKTGGSTGMVRLCKFQFSRTDAYIIEMGVEYFRFYTNGGQVVSPGTTPYEVAHTYTESELADIHFSQLNDVIYLAHPDHHPATLTRNSATSWTLADLAVTGGPFQPDNKTAITLTPSGSNGTINITVTPTNSNLFTVSGATIGHNDSYWKIGTTITDATTGLDVQGYVQLTNVVNTYTATASVIKTLSLAAATTNWAEGSWSAVAGYPARVSFHQQRLFFARTATQPQNIWGSKTFVFTDFAVDGAADDDGINIQVASNESNDIKWLSSGRALVAGTYGGEFVVNSGDDSPLTPSNTNVTKQNSWGSEPIQPQIIGNYMYYVQRYGKKLRELFYFWNLDTYKSVDKTILSPQIAGDGFKEMTFQQNPDTVLWLVRTDGTIATMTREIDQEVQAWARQTTAGTYETISTIPSQVGAYDEVWIVVNREINSNAKRYVERFYNQEPPLRQDKCVYLHSALSYDAYDATSSGTVNLSLAATDGTSVIVTSSSAYFTAADVGDRIRAIDAGGDTKGELKIIGYTSTTIVVGKVVYPFTATAYDGGLWGMSVTSLSGLDHLETEEVAFLGDGGVDLPNKTVSNGTVTLAYNYFVIAVGLPYTQKLKTLPQEAGSQRGTAQGKIQRINQVGFKVNRSHSGFLTGGSEAYLDQIQWRDPTTLMGTPETLYTGTIPNISFRDDYRYGSQVLIYNSDPLPIEMLSIITTIDTQDK